MEELLEEKKFEMRAYDKAELALLYCPGRSEETALKTMMRWIRQCEPLMEALDGTASCVGKWSRLSVTWENLEKRERSTFPYCRTYVFFQFSVYHSAGCCTSLSLFLYLSGPFLVHHRLRFSTSFPSFQYLFLSILVLVSLLSCTGFCSVSADLFSCDVSILYQFVSSLRLLPLTTDT